MIDSLTESGSAWIASIGEGCALDNFSLKIQRQTANTLGIKVGDWVFGVQANRNTFCVGCIFRIRSTIEHTYLYFDQFLSVVDESALSSLELRLPAPGKTVRLQWSAFDAAVNALFGTKPRDIPRVQNHNYVRELLQNAVTDDLLGPANGPYEIIIDMGVRERYLVGKLAPQNTNERNIEGLQGSLAFDDLEEEPEDLNVHTGRHDPGAEFDSTSGKVDAEAEASEEIDAASNQSLVPSSFGLTFCVDADTKQLDVDVSWGRYERLRDHDYYRIQIDKETGEEKRVLLKVWQRIPCGGKLKLSLVEGVVNPQSPDPNNTGVKVQGTIRPKTANGDRLVTLFLINSQDEPETNKDSAWVFQPEVIVRAPDDVPSNAIFRRRPLPAGQNKDVELASLEMIYRKQVEFAVGHGVSVHATPAPENSENAIEVRTQVMPAHEVPITETPGLNADDRSAMREMIGKGYLDMSALADMERPKLVKVLSILTDDYAAWIATQRGRIGNDVGNYDEQAEDAMTRCEEIHKRLEEGIAVLADQHDDTAFTAFRFANRAMAQQRIRSIFALDQRRHGNLGLDAIDIPKNRSWRPFQLAFVLLSIPSLANPLHKDRTKPLEADADLLWFPTGGGKTEAYLGVAAFTMAIRRLQGQVGIYDSSRGLAVIMRYTLRLLTLQQFQRATTLLCAMEVLRRKTVELGDESLGETPFTIGLWVGNKVTPGRTLDSHKAIKDIRDPDKWDAGSSPAQLTSCPWCGSEIDPGRDIEVDRDILRTTIYCGDKKNRCDFSKGKSSKQAHPGLPAVVVDEEIYHRPPSMMIATVDKFALMAWRGEARTLFGRATSECERHGLLWPEADCTGNHPKKGNLRRTQTRTIKSLRPPDLIIQDEFHLISGPLGTMVGLYETAVDELSTWYLGDQAIKPKIIASTATVRKAREQINNVFMRQVCVFPPHGLDLEDNFFSVQRPIAEKPGRRYLGICSPGSSRPAMLIRIYTALLTASQDLFEHFGDIVDPYMTTVGYFNSLRELGGMRRLAEDDVQTRAYRVLMSRVARPGLAQRSIQPPIELTSRISSQDIPKHLDKLEIGFEAQFDSAKGKYVSNRGVGEDRAVDVVLATNMLSVGVDVNRLGLMAMNGQPKGTAEYIQATSRVGRQYPGLVCTVLTWARPRDLSHYETFEHYHATFYKHVEAQSVTPFSPRAMDRGLTGAMLSVMRLEHEDFNPNSGAGALDRVDRDDVKQAMEVVSERAWSVSDTATRDLATKEMKERVDEWAKEASIGGRNLGYEKRGQSKDRIVALLKRPGIQAWDDFTVPMSMREVEPGVRLIMSTTRGNTNMPNWSARPPADNNKDGSVSEAASSAPSTAPKQSALPKLVDLHQLINRDLTGQTIDVMTADGSKQKFRFLSTKDKPPRKNDLVIVLHSGFSQPDIDGSGVAYGRWSLAKLQDAESGTSQVNIKVVRKGFTRSVSSAESQWRESIQVGIATDS